MIVSFASWRWIFVFLSLYGVVILLLAVFLVDETLSHFDLQALRLGRIASAWGVVLRNPELLVYGAIATLAVSTLVIYLANASALFIDDLWPVGQPVRAGVLRHRLVLGRGQPRQCAAGGRVPLKRLIGVGIVLGSLTLAAEPRDLARRCRRLLGAAARFLRGFFFCFGLMVSNSMTLALAPHGAIIGVASAAQGVLQAVVPAILASLSAAAYDGTPLPTLLAMLLLVLVSGAVLLASGRSTYAPAINRPRTGTGRGFRQRRPDASPGPRRRFVTGGGGTRAARGRTPTGRSPGRRSSRT